MELCSLHPLDLNVVERYVAAVRGDHDAPVLEEVAARDPAWTQRILVQARRGYSRAQDGNESGANAVSYGLGQVLAASYPSFAEMGLSLSTIEARIDRGVGMLIRPPSRLFSEAGLDQTAARTMPIRLDLSQGLMGGGFIPARLVPEFEALLERRLKRFLRRLDEAEFDNVAVLGLLIETAAYARERNLGLFEAMDVVAADDTALAPPGALVIGANRKWLDPTLRERLEEAAKPPKRPGLIARLLGRQADPNVEI